MQQKQKALYQESMGGETVRCHLCPHRCAIKADNTGICGARSNAGGVLFADTYGRVTSIAMDPIEKKPLYHFHPGTRILSIGSAGCNMKCPFCQNWSISQKKDAMTEYYPPEDMVSLAVENGSIGVAYTYNEPIIWAEYVLDTSAIAVEKGLVNVMVSNGYVEPGPLGELLRTVDGFNIDLKSFNESTYRKVMKAGLAEVKKTIEKIYEASRHVEVTTLIVTGINDTMDEMRAIIKYLSSISRSIPWHISRYYPNYKYGERATDTEFIFRVREQALEQLDFVYCGNVPAESGGNDTRCPGCGSVAIKRMGYSTRLENYDNGRCSHCGRQLNVVT